MQEVLEEFFKTTKAYRSALDYYHTCDHNCRLWHSKKRIACVCIKFRAVHLCGEDCLLSGPSYNNEGMVCVLTGYVTGEVLPGNIHGSMFDKYGSACGLGMARSNYQTPSGNNAAVHTEVKSSLNKLFLKSNRKTIYLHKIKRGGKTIRTTLMKHKNNFMVSHIAFVTELLQNTVGCSPGVNPENEELDELSTNITNYWAKLNLKQKTATHISAFTAAIIEKLRVGEVRHGIQVFPIHPLVAIHAPSELMAGPLLNIQCRTITNICKLLNQKLYTDGGIPKSEYIFKPTLKYHTPLQRLQSKTQS